METNDFISGSIALYGAILSSCLAWKSWIHGKPKLSFTHDYDLKKRKINIIITNISTNPIDIIKGEYNIGKTVALDIKLPTTIKSHQSIAVEINLFKQHEIFFNVNKFTFTSSINQIFDYPMERSIIEDLRLKIGMNSLENSLFDLEQIGGKFDKSIEEIIKIEKEFEDNIIQYRNRIKETELNNDKNYKDTILSR